jgi:hypothetical protein
MIVDKPKIDGAAEERKVHPNDVLDPKTGYSFAAKMSGELDALDSACEAKEQANERSAPSYLIEGMSREKLVALCKRWEKAHCEAGLIGSEYYADPERVFQRVREQRDSLHRGLMRAMQREKASGLVVRGEKHNYEEFEPGTGCKV